MEDSPNRRLALVASKFTIRVVEDYPCLPSLAPGVPRAATPLGTNFRRHLEMRTREPIVPATVPLCATGRRHKQRLMAARQHLSRSDLPS